MGNQQVQSSSSSNKELEKVAREQFKRYSKNGSITKPGFISAVGFLEAYGFIRLGNTPLGDRLYNIFDTDRSGTLEEDEYLQGVISLIESEESRIRYSFKCFDCDEDEKISKNEFVKMYELSWMQAFEDLQAKMLSDPKSKDNPNSKKIVHWAEAQRPKLAAEVAKDFKTYTTTEYMDYKQFREWIKNTEMPYIEVIGPNCRIRIPMNLHSLH